MMSLPCSFIAVQGRTLFRGVLFHYPALLFYSTDIPVKGDFLIVKDLTQTVQVNEPEAEFYLKHLKQLLLL